MNGVYTLAYAHSTPECFQCVRKCCSFSMWAFVMIPKKRGSFLLVQNFPGKPLLWHLSCIKDVALKAMHVWSACLFAGFMFVRNNDITSCTAFSTWHQCIESLSQEHNLHRQKPVFPFKPVYPSYLDWFHLVCHGFLHVNFVWLCSYYSVCNIPVYLHMLSKYMCIYLYSIFTPLQVIRFQKGELSPFCSFLQAVCWEFWCSEPREP